MPRKASARKSTARKTATTAARPETDLERRARKNADPAHRAASDETARRNASAQTVGPEAHHPSLTSSQQKEAAAVVTPGAAKNEVEVVRTAPRPPDLEAIKRQQEEDKADAKRLAESRKPPNLSKAVAKAPTTKILREQGTPPKPLGEGVDKVQQGGGGTISGMGQFIR